MNMQKAIATIIILAGSVLVAAVFRDIAFPAILCMLGLLGLQRRFTWDIRPERRVITSLLLLLLAVLFALHYTYGGIGRGYEQVSIVAWETISRYFLASMILILFLGSPQRLPPSLALFYMATVLSAGQVLLLDDLYMPFRLLEAASVILIVLYAAAGRTVDTAAHTPQTPRALPYPSSILTLVSDNLRSRRWVAPGIILLIAVNLGWVTGSVLYRHVELLNYVPVWLWHGAAGIETSIDNTAYVGFSSSGVLSSVLRIKGEQDTTTALRIMSDVNPGYLRARAFDLYRQGEWNDVSATRSVFASQNMPFSGSLPGRMNFFRLNDRRPANAHEMMIRHEVAIRDAIFTSLGALSVESTLPYVNYDDDGIVSPPYARNNLSYRITFADLTYAPSPMRPMTGVPPQLDPRVRQLADRIFAGTVTTADKIQAVVNHFRTNYTYSLSMSPPPPDRDKLDYFLLEQKSGYCEYFASGAAILLRMAKVPTRYVTGFLVTEKDTDGQAWVARNMDAHAWVEAWDQENSQWAIVEATVQDGLGTLSTDDDSTGAGGLNRYLLIGQLINYLYEYGLFGVLAWALQYYGLPAVSLLLATALGGTFWWLYRRAKARGAHDAARPLTPEIMALHKLLAHVDRIVRAAGPRRDLNETLQTFAHRLRTQESGDGLWTRVSDWYIEYAALRYSRTMPPDRLQHLHRLAALLQES